MTVAVGVLNQNSESVNRQSENTGVWSRRREVIDGKDYILITGKWDVETMARDIQEEFIRYLRSNYHYIFNSLLNLLGEQNPTEDFDTLSKVYTLRIVSPVISKKKISIALYIDKENIEETENGLRDAIYHEFISAKDVPYFLFAPKGDNQFILKYKFRNRIQGKIESLALILNCNIENTLTRLNTSLLLDKDRLTLKNDAKALTNTTYSTSVCSRLQPIDALIFSRRIISETLISLSNL